MFYSKRVQITTPKGFLWFGCAGVIIGLFLSVMAFFVYSSDENFVKIAKHAPGTVVNLVETINNNNNNSSTSTPTISYFPVVSFKVNEHDYTFTSNSGSNPPQYQQGQSVDVMYDPQNPLNADINSGSTQWFGVIIFAVLGVSFAGFGVFFIVFRNKIRPQNMINPPPFQNFN